MLNPEAKLELERILSLDKGDLTEADKDFIRARHSYLSEEQKAAYADVLAGEGGPAVEAEESASNDDEPAPAKKSKR